MEDHSIDLEFEEWNARSVCRIATTCDVLSLRNRSAKFINELALAEDLARIAGIERIKSLIIRPSSMVKNLLFLKALPSLETLQLNGLKLRSLDGLKSFQSGQFIKIDTGNNRKRDIAKIAETQITRLSLHWGNPGDLQAIGRSSTIKELIVSNCPKLTLNHWSRVPIETMSLYDGSIHELGETRDLRKLRNVTLFGCRKLKQFVGDNSNVTWIVMQSCNQVDLSTISTFRRLQFIIIVNIKNDLPLSTFGGLVELRSLSFQQCNVRIDMMHLKRSMPKLEKLLITGLNKNEAASISRASSDVIVSNGAWSYKNGMFVEAHS